MGFFSNIFGPSKADVWRDLAKTIGAQWVDGGFWKGDHILYSYKEWTFLLDTFTRQTGKNSVSYTRLRVPFKSKTKLFLRIHQEHFLFPIFKFFGAKDIQLGDKEFDKKFIIKANNEFEIIQLLNEIKLKALLMKMKKGYIEVKEKDSTWRKRHFPQDVDLLYYEAIGLIKNKKDLLNLFAIFCSILDRSVHLNLISKDDPHIQLEK